MNCSYAQQSPEIGAFVKSESNFVFWPQADEIIDSFQLIRVGY